MQCNPVKSYMRDLYEAYDEADDEELDLKKAVLDFIKSSKSRVEGEIPSTSKDELLTQISQFVESKSLGLSTESIGAYLYGINEDVESTEAKTTEDIVVNYKRQYSRAFLDKIFMGAATVQMQTIAQNTYNLRKALFYNENGIVQTEADFNENIRKYQNELFKQVKEFLNDYYDSDSIEQNLKDMLSGESVLYKDGKYTGNFEKLKPLAERAFAYFNRETLNRESSKPNSRTLEAFKNYYLLKHFDEFMTYQFGDNIGIKYFNQFTDGSNYTLNNKATSMFWANNQDDDIDVGASTNNISKTLVTTSRRFSYLTKAPLPNSFITYNEFINTLNAIKELAQKPDKINLLSINNEGDYTYMDVSEDTISFIEQFSKVLNSDTVTLKDLISYTREYGAPAYKALFELLSSEPIRERADYRTLIQNYGDVIYSLNQELFSGEESLWTAQNKSGYEGNNYYSYLLQTMDSTWPVKNASFYQDADGKISITSLKGTNITQLQRNLDAIINVLNSPTVSKLTDKYKVDYRDNKMYFTVKRDGQDIQLVLNSSLQVESEDGKFKALDMDAQKEASWVIPFIDDVLHMNFRSLDSNTWQYYESTFPTAQGAENALRPLFNFAAEVLHNQYVIKKVNEALNSGVVTKATNLKDKILELSKNYTKSSLSFSRNLKTINVINPKQIHILEALAETKAKSEGMTNAVTVKDSEQKTLSTATPSRLLSTYQQQFSRIKNNPRSPAMNFSILNPNIFEDIYTMREIRKDGETKQYKDFSTGEFLESSLLWDFLQPAIVGNDGKYDTVRKGFVSLTPSVNSDKNTVSKVIINLGRVVKDLGYKDIKEFLTNPTSIAKFRQHADAELGGYYATMLSHIQEDIDKLTSSQSWQAATDGFKLQYNPESFVQLNRIIKNRGLNARELFRQASVETGVGIKEPLHVIFGKNQVHLNMSIISLDARLNNKTNVLRKHCMYNSAQFWKRKNAEFLQYMIKSGSTIQLNDDVKIQDFIIENYPTWITRSGKLILGKYKSDDGTEHLITNEIDLQLLGNKLGDPGIVNHPETYSRNLELNPLLERYNMIDYLYSEEFILSTVGSHVNHPSQAKTSSPTIFTEESTEDLKQFTTEHQEMATFADFDQEVFNYIRNSEYIKAKKLLEPGLDEDAYAQELVESWKETGADLGPNFQTLEGEQMSINEFIKTRYDELKSQANADNKLLIINQQQAKSIIGIDKGNSYPSVTKAYKNHTMDKELRALANNYIIDEASRYKAQDKRNVSNTASKHEFLLKDLKGIPTYYNVAVTEDIKDYVTSVGGDTSLVKPFDGATFVNPFVVLLENYSLKGEKAGVHKKQFVHFYDEETGTGGIVKTAGFGLTNSWMRNSPFLQLMMKKMTDIPWGMPIDITKTIQNSDTHSKPVNWDNIYYYNVVDEQQRYYKITNIEKLDPNAVDPETNIPYGEGAYRLTKQRVDSTGKPMELPADAHSEEIVTGVNSNYQLWSKVFKGLNSVSLAEDGKFQPSENSIENVVKAMNSCGYIKEGYDRITSQDDYYQPMKYSDTHYDVTEGALKQGTQNYNEAAQSYYGRDYKYNRFRMGMFEAGIQLDKEHHADGSEISMMTQVVSACAALGYTWDESNAMYKALQSLAMNGISPMLDPLTKMLGDFNEKTQFEFKKTLADLFVKALSGGSKSKDGLINTVMSQLIEKYNSGQKLEDADYQNVHIPVSDPAVFNKFQSLLGSILTKAAIKMKFSGILSVMVPSHEIMKIYGNHLRGDFYDPETQIAELQAENENILQHYDQLNQCPTWQKVVGADIQMQDVGIQNFKAISEFCKKANITTNEFWDKITEEYREINPDFEGNIKPLLDISQVQLGRHYKILDAAGNVVDEVMIQSPDTPAKALLGDPTTKYVGYYDLRNQFANEYNGYTLVEDVTKGRNLGAYNFTFQDNEGNTYNMYDLADSYNLFHKVEGATKKILQETLRGVHEGGQVNVFVDGQLKTVTVNNLDIIPYEVIMSKTMATQLGLTSRDNLADLVNDKDSFTKKFVSNLAVKIPDYNAFTVALKKVNGKHQYILTEEQFKQYHGNDLVQAEIYPPVTDESGRIYRVDQDGKKLYQMASNKDRIYTINGQEVIVTSNLEHYLQNSNYGTLEVSQAVDATNFQKIIDADVTNKAFTNWKKFMAADNTLKSMENNKQLAKMTYHDGAFWYDNHELDLKNLSYIKNLGNELYSSFKKSLEIIAARIPAQSMQSFMPMRVVGYEGTNNNNAYVSTHQIWLQGSDYDIDCVSLLTYELGRDGKLVGWSPLFRYDSEENLEESMKLDYPTGQDTKAINAADILKPEDDIVQGVANYTTELLSGFTIKQGKKGYYLNANSFTDLVNMVNRISRQGLLDFDSLTNDQKQGIVDAMNTIHGTKMSIDDMSAQFKYLKGRADIHNQYINTSDQAESFTKNFIVDKMIKIGKDPRNLIQAQTSVDQTTGIPKKIAALSEASKLLNDATPGNMANKYQSIEDNHVGKDVIGISAVGLKTFFALSQYYNTIMKEGNEAKIKKVLAKALEFHGEEYYGLANVQGTSENEEILGYLNSMYNREDAALMISALLSLATDNAKELCLAKLNADAKMAGMYIYGLSKGISFKELGQLLMSDVGSVVSSLMKGNIVNDDLGISTIDQAIKYIQSPFTTLLRTGQGMKTYAYSATEKQVKSISVWSILAPFTYKASVQNKANNSLKEEASKKVNDFGIWLNSSNEIAQKWRQYTQDKKNNSNPYNAKDLVKWLLKATRNGDLTLEEASAVCNLLSRATVEIKHEWEEVEDTRIKRDDKGEPIKVKDKNGKVVKDENGNDKVELETYKHKVIKRSNEVDVASARMYALNRFLDQVKQAILIQDKVRRAESNLWAGAVQDFINLRQGAEEFKVMGQFLGANQGVKNEFTDYLKYVNNFEHVIDKRRAVGNKYGIGRKDFEQKCEELGLDKGDVKIDFERFIIDDNYRENMMDLYDTSSFTENPLRVMWEVPHYRGYLYAVYGKHGYMKASSITYRTLYKELDSIKEDVGTMTQDKMIKSVNRLTQYKLIDKFLQNKKFILPKGMPVVSVTGSRSTTHEAPSDMTIYLGTYGGNATYKNWVEQEVIPNIQQGYYGSDRTKQAPFLASNEFVEKLVPNIYSLNPNKENSISYKPDVNMMPRSEEETSTLDRVRTAFDKLSAINYKMADGTLIPLQDIFYLYNMIAYQNRAGEGTMTSIFDNFQDSALAKEYREVVSNLDASQDIISLSYQDKEYWAAQVESPFSSNSEVIYYNNQQDLKMQLMRKVEQSDETPEVEESSMVGNYTPVSNGTYDSNLITVPVTTATGDMFVIPKTANTPELRINAATRTLTESSIKDLILTEAEQKTLAKENDEKLPEKTKEKIKSIKQKISRVKSDLNDIVQSNVEYKDFQAGFNAKSIEAEIQQYLHCN